MWPGAHLICFFFFNKFYYGNVIFSSQLNYTERRYQTPSVLTAHLLLLKLILKCT